MTPAHSVPRTLVLVAACAVTTGCLVEYVIPEPGTTEAPQPDPTEATRVTDTASATTADATDTDAEDPTASEESGEDSEEEGGDACEPPRVACGEACVDLQTDEAHCGKCGDGCGDGEMCLAGDCEGWEPTECGTCPCPACGDGTRCCVAPGEGEAEVVYCLLTDDVPCPEGQ